jgi:uncharacterized membrane protein YfcA
MPASLTVALIVLGGVAAGAIGSLTGLGGGVVMVPLLTLAFHLPMPEAVGVSLLGVIATSTGAAPRFVGTGLSNARVALFLQVAASSGALAGALVAHRLPLRFLFTLFGIVLAASAFMTFTPRPSDLAGPPRSSALARRLRFPSRYQHGGRWIPYQVVGVVPGFLLMIGAGLISALLGIGSGAFKVLAMDRVMKLPFRVSTATSNFMIGITAATSAGFYLSNGDIPPVIAGAAILGVLVGASAGARLVRVLSGRTLRSLFAALLSVVALRMLFEGLFGS